MDHTSRVEAHKAAVARAVSHAIGDYIKEERGLEGGRVVATESMVELTKQTCSSVPFQPEDLADIDDRISDCGKRLLKLNLDADASGESLWDAYHTLGLSYTERFRRSWDMTDLRQADAAFRTARFVWQDVPTERRLHVTFGTAEMLTEYFLQSGDTSALKEAEGLFRGIIWGRGVDRDKILSIRVLATSRLCMLESMVSKHRLNLESLDFNLKRMRRTKQETPTNHEGLPWLLEGGGMILLTRAKMAGSPGDVEKAIEYFRGGYDALLPQDMRAWRLRSHLGAAFRQRFLAQEDERDLEMSRSMIEEALQTEGLICREIAHCRLELAETLLANAQYSTEPKEALKRCAREIEQAKKALYMLDTPEWLRLWHLDSLRLRHLHTVQDMESRGSLEKSISVMRKTCQVVRDNNHWETDFAEMPHLVALGEALLARGRDTRSLSDIDESILVLRKAAGLVGTKTGVRCALLQVPAAKLSEALRQRFYALQRRKDIQEAALWMDKAALCPGPLARSERVKFVLELGSIRRESLQDETALSLWAIALDHYCAAKAMGCKEIESRESCDAFMALAYENIAVSQQDDREIALRHYRKAEQHLREAYGIKEPQLTMPSGLALGLAQIQHRMWRLTEDPTFGEAALATAYVALRPSAPISVAALEVAEIAGKLEALLHKNWEKASENYGLCATILQHVATEGHTQTEQKMFLLEWSRIPSTAATYALMAGHPEPEVLRQLETTRSLFWERRLNSRLSYDEAYLRYPTMARQLRELRAMMLDTTEQNRVTHARRFAGLVELVRFTADADFLRWRLTDDLLKDLVRDGPVVLFVHSISCYALVASERGVSKIALPLFHEAACIRQYSRFSRALGNIALCPVQAKEQIGDVLSWIWDAAAEPVLKGLGFTRRESKSSDLPRVWWILSGWASLLPIHAAGHHKASLTDDIRTDVHTVIDCVVSSYIPTARALLYSRNRMDHLTSRCTPDEQKTALLLAMEKTMDKPPKLPHAPVEAETVASILESSFQISKHIRPAPTHDVALDGLRDCTIAHLACHAEAHQDPMESMIYLRDWYCKPLKVASLMSLDTNKCQLAYLAACETAVIVEEGLREENLHISGALQMAGIPNTVATWWRIVDGRAVDVAAGFYRGLKSTEGDFDIRKAARSLHKVARNMRDATHDPFIWGAYVHSGC
ncbi:CHAT domain-containing protein [Corynascus novoguineensis]|uniref:CHAT domain-containing protein n=1 Tax=Corynascus novoguineensis TaxID=1126955 RepID=A0AAN7CKQ1_9PEZI|nr:CHAT domain-containing protein [Corynascus novoguineensis]